MNLPPTAQQVANPQRLVSRLDQAFRRLNVHLHDIFLFSFFALIEHIQAK
jgi:hypothetical protein